MADEFEEVADQYIDSDTIDPLWNLSEDLSITDAAALIAGYNPTAVDRCKTDTFFDRVFPRYELVLKSLRHAVTNDRMNATIRYAARDYGYADQIADIEYAEIGDFPTFGNTAGDDEELSDDHRFFYKPFPDWSLSTVARDDLVTWLRSRGIHNGFFFPDAADEPDYLNPTHPRYAAKLAAAINAWLAMDDSTLHKRKSPKQALDKWIRENAAKFGLTDPEGNPVNQAVEECSKVANWSQTGGAPKTPAG